MRKICIVHGCVSATKNIDFHCQYIYSCIFSMGRRGKTCIINLLCEWISESQSPLCTLLWAEQHASCVCCCYLASSLSWYNIGQLGATLSHLDDYDFLMVKNLFCYKNLKNIFSKNYIVIILETCAAIANVCVIVSLWEPHVCNIRQH